MARGTPGLRKVGNGWKNNSLYRGNKRVSVAPPSAEDQARSSALMDAACEALSQGKAEEFMAAIRDRDAADTEGNDALAREKDREARIAVEGDTALDHLPFGGSGE